MKRTLQSQKAAKTDWTRWTAKKGLQSNWFMWTFGTVSSPSNHCAHCRCGYRGFGCFPNTRVVVRWKPPLRATWAKTQILVPLSQHAKELSIVAFTRITVVMGCNGTDVLGLHILRLHLIVSTSCLGFVSQNSDVVPDRGMPVGIVIPLLFETNDGVTRPATTMVYINVFCEFMSYVALTSPLISPHLSALWLAAHCRILMQCRYVPLTTPNNVCAWQQPPQHFPKKHLQPICSNANFQSQWKNVLDLKTGFHDLSLVSWLLTWTRLHLAHFWSNLRAFQAVPLLPTAPAVAVGVLPRGRGTAVALQAPQKCARSTG